MAAQAAAGSRTGLRYFANVRSTQAIDGRARSSASNASAVAGHARDRARRLGRQHQRVQQRRGGQVSHRERVAHEVLATVELLLEAVEALA